MAENVSNNHAGLPAAEKTKVCIATSSRADFSKLEPLLAALHQHPTFEAYLVVSGSHLLLEGGNTVNEIEGKYPIYARIYTVVSGDSYETMAESVSLGISKFTGVLSVLQPHFVVVHGDRFDALALALASSLLHLCTVHIEGGELSGTIDGSIRHAITKMSHLHFVCNEQAQRRLMHMGEVPSRIVVTGCPSYDRFASLSIGERQMQTISTKYTVSPAAFVIVLHHPNTNYPEETLHEFRCILDFFALSSVRVLFFYPNIDPGNKKMIKLLHEHQKNNPGIYKDSVKILSHVPYDEFAILLKAAQCIIGNSSSGVRESCVFGTPSIIIGSRQFGRAVGRNATLLETLSGESLLEAYKSIAAKRYEPEYIYGTGNAVEKMIEALEVFDFKNVAKDFYDVVRG